MKGMIRIEPSELATSPIDLIGKEWMLVSAGGESGANSMTASWGSMGFMFNRNIVNIVVRPERYTYEFLERESHFTITILEDGHREALTVMGKQSGRDGDKVAAAGLARTFTPSGLATFAEAKIVLECRKLYGQMMSEESFVDHSIYEKWFGEGHGNLHKMYIGEIEACWVKE